MPGITHRIGIIGAGFGAQVHVPAFQAEGWEVPAICSRDRDKAARAAQAAGIEGVHTDPLELIRRDDLTAVAISTPPDSHCELGLAALAAGKHVLCEKPLAVTAPQAKRMHDAAQACGLTAMVSHEYRFSPQRARIRELLRDGYVGTFRLCTLELFSDRHVTPQPRPLTWDAHGSQGGGLLSVLGSHYIDCLHDWFGDVAAATGQLATLRPHVLDRASGRVVLSETDDTFQFNLQFRDGGMATMAASFSVTPARGGRIVVMGDAGTLVAEHRGPSPPEDGIVLGSHHGSLLQELPMPERLQPFSDRRDHRLMAFRLLVREFTRGIESGTSPSPNFNDGWRVQQVIDAIRQSSRTGRRINMAG